jgi:hypothetical protein
MRNLLFYCVTLPHMRNQFIWHSVGILLVVIQFCLQSLVFKEEYGMGERDKAQHPLETVFSIHATWCASVGGNGWQ